MSATKVPRFSGIIRVIGALIVAPSFLGVCLSFMTCFATTDAAQATIATAQSDAGAAGAAVGAGIGYGIAFFIGASSLVGGLLGWLLLLKRKVYRCLRCGFILARA